MVCKGFPVQIYFWPAFEKCTLWKDFIIDSLYRGIELCSIAVKRENLHMKICRNYLEFFSKVVYIFLVCISHGFSDILGKIHKFSNTFYSRRDIATPHYLLCCSNYSSFCH